MWFRQHTKEFMIGHDDPLERIAQPDTAIGRLFSKTFSEFQPYFSRVNSLQDHDFDKHPIGSSMPASQDSMMNRRVGATDHGLFYAESRNGIGSGLHILEASQNAPSRLHLRRQLHRIRLLPRKLSVFPRTWCRNESIGSQQPDLDGIPGEFVRRRQHPSISSADPRRCHQVSRQADLRAPRSSRWE